MKHIKSDQKNCHCKHIYYVENIFCIMNLNVTISNVHPLFFLCLFNRFASSLLEVRHDSQSASFLSFPHSILILMSSNNTRRSARLHDPSYRPRTTWNLPRIVSVSFFITVQTIRHLYYYGYRQLLAHLKMRMMMSPLMMSFPFRLRLVEVCFVPH